MHELFLTAVVPDAELSRAQALLQGLCGMATAHTTVTRVLFFAGPATAAQQLRGLAVRRALQASQLQVAATARAWSELHQQLSRQSYVVQARYAVDGNVWGRAGQGMAQLDAASGTLRWADIPDPTPTGSGGTTGSNRLVMQRKTLDLSDVRHMPTLLQDNQYRFKSEIIEESFAYFTNDTEYTLVRYHRLPSTAAPTESPTPLDQLPTWEDVVDLRAPGAVDPAGQWLLHVRRRVLDAATAPDTMAQGLEALEAARVQLAGAFAFRAADRRVHDTRIERPATNMPAPLPQRVRV